MLCSNLEQSFSHLNYFFLFLIGPSAQFFSWSQKKKSYPAASASFYRLLELEESLDDLDLLSSPVDAGTPSKTFPSSNTNESSSSSAFDLLGDIQLSSTSEAFLPSQLLMSQLQPGETFPFVLLFNAIFPWAIVNLKKNTTQTMLKKKSKRFSKIRIKKWTPHKT